MAEIARRGLVPAAQRILVLSGCTFAGVGVVDVGTAESLASNVFGVVLALVGGALLATAFGLWRRRPWTGAAGVFALGAAAALAVYLSLNAWDEGRPWGLLFAAIAAASVVAAIAVVAVCPPRLNVTSASMFSVACVVGAVFQFTYVESARVRAGSTLTTTTDLSPAGGDPVDAVTAIVRTENPTDAKIQSVGSLYVVEGIRHCRRDPREGAHELFGRVFGDPGAATAFAPRVSEQDVVTIQAGKVFDDRTYFEPGEELVRRFSVPVPKGKFDVVRLRVTVAVANGDRLQLDEVVRGPTILEPKTAGVRGVGIMYRVSEGSLVDRIMHEDRVVEVVWESGTEEVTPVLWASARLAGDSGAGADRSASYAMAYTGSTTELPLERSKTARRREAREPSRAGASPRAALFWPPPRVRDGDPDPDPFPSPEPPGAVPPPTPTPEPSPPRVKGRYVVRPTDAPVVPQAGAPAPAPYRPKPYRPKPHDARAERRNDAMGRPSCR